MIPFDPKKKGHRTSRLLVDCKCQRLPEQIWADAWYLGVPRRPKRQTSRSTFSELQLQKKRPNRKGPFQGKGRFLKISGCKGNLEVASGFRHFFRVEGRTQDLPFENIGDSRGVWRTRGSDNATLRCPKDWLVHRDPSRGWWFQPYMVGKVSKRTLHLVQDITIVGAHLAHLVVVFWRVEGLCFGAGKIPEMARDGFRLRMNIIFHRIVVYIHHCNPHHNLHPGKLTWNLKITLFEKEKHLPNLHFKVPC